MVATHVPVAGLEVPVGVQTKDHLDTQVYAYKSSKKTSSPHRDSPIESDRKPPENNNKKVSLPRFLLKVMKVLNFKYFVIIRIFILENNVFQHR